MQEPFPNTKDGMVGSNEKIIPEYFQETKHNLEDGDFMILYDKDGKEIKRFTYNKDEKKWE